MSSQTLLELEDVLIQSAEHEIFHQEVTGLISALTAPTY